jgi:hypothetical protein
MDEIIIRFQDRVSEATIIPGKLIPTGFKVWNVTQQGFQLLWN